MLFILCMCLLLIAPAVAFGTDYKAPLPYPTMFDQLAIGITWRQAYEITRAQELQQEPADLETTDLLRLKSADRHCQGQLLRLHWYKGALHWVEYIQLDSAGVTYQERGHPDPVAEGLVSRLTDIAHLYASRWEELTASIAQEGSSTLQARAKEATDSLKRQLEELRHERQR